jgi:hypothetical protein
MSVNWGFVEIDSVDADADVFDYRIYWKQWDDSEPQLTVRWCLAAFIMFDSDASNSDASNGEQVRSEKIVADMKEIFKTKQVLETLEAKFEKPTRTTSFCGAVGVVQNWRAGLYL